MDVCHSALNLKPCTPNAARLKLKHGLRRKELQLQPGNPLRLHKFLFIIYLQHELRYTVLYASIGQLAYLDQAACFVFGGLGFRV